MCPFDPATSSGVPGRVTPFRSSAAVVPSAGSCRRAWYHTGGTRSPRCISFAMSAAPLVVRLPATAPLLLPAAGPRHGAAGEAPDRLPSRTFSTAALGTGTAAVAAVAAVASTGASQLVPSGEKKASPTFQLGAHSGPRR